MIHEVEPLNPMKQKQLDLSMKANMSDGMTEPDEDQLEAYWEQPTPTNHMFGSIQEEMFKDHIWVPKRER